MADLRFDGWIAGLGTASGWRVVVGCWTGSPYGPVADVMLERPDGHRLLVAPTRELADFVASTYTFDEIAIAAVTVHPPHGDPHGAVTIAAGRLQLELEVGRSTWLGRLVRLVPRLLAEQLWWVALCDRPARLLASGVRTRGSAGGGRREWYSASDNRAIVSVTARWDGTDLGPLAEVTPPVRFGFGSTPRRPSLTLLRTTVRVPSAAGEASAPR